MLKPKGLTRTVAAHVTPEEYDRIKAHALNLGQDVSTITRELWLSEIGLQAADPARTMLHLFVRTMEASLELGEEFDVAKFREICAEVIGKEDAAS